MPPKKSKLNPDPEPVEEEKPKESGSSLDPILPLPANTAIPPLKQGEGVAILANTTLMVVELPYRAFYNLWEYAERRAREQYVKNVGKPGYQNDYAETLVDAVHAFRSAARGEILPILSESEAQKIRAKEAKRNVKKRPLPPGEDGSDRCPNCREGDVSWVKKKAKNGEKLWKCSRCGHRWPRLAPESRSKGSKRGSGTNDASKRQKGAEKPRKRAQK